MDVIGCENVDSSKHVPCVTVRGYSYGLHPNSILEWFLFSDNNVA